MSAAGKTGEHTPTPWGIANPGEAPLYIAAGAWPFGSNIAQCEGENQEANAGFIVRAVNNHEPMVESLEHCATLFDTLAQTMDGWAAQSREGGWSTHQVEDNRKRADDCRRYAAHIRKGLTLASPSLTTAERSA